jgi:hypothetical protein
LHTDRNAIMQKFVLFSILLSFSWLSNAQDLCAYSDYRGHFFIFDHGKSLQVEDMQVQSFAIGGECVLYLNNQGNLKMYRDGIVTKLEPGGIAKYFATDHLASYQIFDQLYVVVDNQPMLLSRRCPIFQVQDSLIVYYDNESQLLNIFYKDEIHEIESGLIGRPVSRLSSGDNIVAYVSNRTRDFKIWYKGINYTLIDFVDGISFKAGKDIVAYTKTNDNTFHAFYKGNDVQLEEFLPKSFLTGDGFVAYIDNSGSFKAYYGGQITTISNYSPDSYFANDNLLVYTEYNTLKLFHNGEIHELEGYVPKNFRFDWNTLAYLDNSNRIWVYSNGEKKYLTNDLIESFEVYRDLILIRAKMDRNLIYYKNQFYTGLSY